MISTDIFKFTDFHGSKVQISIFGKYQKFEFVHYEKNAENSKLSTFKDPYFNIGKFQDA